MSIVVTGATGQLGQLSVEHLINRGVAPAATTSALILAPEHKVTEEALHDSGVPFTILRNGWYTENYGAAVEQAREHGVYLTSAGDGRVASASRSTPTPSPPRPPRAWAASCTRAPRRPTPRP